MSVEIITKEDLEKFKTDLFKELKQLLPAERSEPKRWLKNSDVRKLLNVSLGTLQNLRLNGTLPYTKIGGTTFYRAEEVEKMLAKGSKS
ncbi:helix-turn-helix domain-containing protein [Pedobacter cryoconitis]|uniref:Helix-turn-helix protein n=1 Tax=Pedobacter cryoconitis TaxID=188932 RepID=A0A327SQL5_9SPHI|nr:helix-turn-helix domain-containing protein [Pedobacter cryoconitis]RAJ31148.1 helix-turn-helix protein [Pedobacter cryoconitis]